MKKISIQPRIIISTTLVLLQLFSVATASGQTNTWNGSSNNNWNTAANWSLNAIPANTHDVVVNMNATIAVNANVTINSLTISGNAVVSFTSSGGGRTITIDDTENTGCTGNDEGGGGSIFTGALTSTIVMNGINTGNGKVAISTISTICTGTGSTRTPGTITVNSFPIASTTVTETSGTVNNDGIICQVASGVITASGGTFYSWNTGSTTAPIIVTPLITITYTITVTNSNNCMTSTLRTVTVNPLPTPATAYFLGDSLF